MRGDATFLKHAGRTLHKLHNAAVAIALPRGYRTTRRMSYISLQSMLCVRVRVSCVCDGIGGCPTSPAKLKERGGMPYTSIPRILGIAGSEGSAECASLLGEQFTQCLHVVQHCCDGCCGSDCSYCIGGCRLFTTARMCRSKELR